MQSRPIGQPGCRIRSVLVVDDHPLYGEALVSALEQLFQRCEVKQATSLGEGLRFLGRSFHPDLVLLDLKLPDCTGISGFLRLQAKLPDVPIVVISAFASAEVVEAVMGAGASAFVPKEIPAKELQAILCDVSEGGTYVPPEFRHPTGATRKRTVEMQEISRKIADLTPQQTRIMRLICAGKPNKQIAYELSLAEATVKAHITALLRRLGVQNRTQAAVLIESANFDSPAEIDRDDVVRV